MLRAHEDVAAESREAKAQLILTEFPSLMEHHERAVAGIRAEREAMEQRHAAEVAEQSAAEVAARAYSRELVGVFPMLKATQIPEDTLLPSVRPDRPSATLTPYVAEEWWPPYLQEAVAASGGVAEPTKERKP